MGLLDDAIREHLELKRRRGANPTDVARQEIEALGATEDEAAAGLLADQADEAWESETPPQPTVHVPTYERAPEPDVHLEPETESSTPPHGDPLGAEALSSHPAHQETREFSSGELEAALGQREEDEDEPPAFEDAAAEAPEDVLEETPDFLQETPEHDRLWFEQKPPKDFDF